MPPAPDLETLLEEARADDRYALARLITHVESNTVQGRDALASLYPHTGKAHATAFTGAPGVGKSTIIDGVIGQIRQGGHSVAVVAVDPSSAFSGGAILGDRVRMLDHAGDSQVYIRSMANRGHLGGLAAATPRVLAVLDGLGFPEILLETVGVGQGEVEVADAADTTVVVVTPGWGDGIQAAKAGFLEIADILVVNKAELGGSDETVKELEAMLELGVPGPWTPPVLTMVAVDGRGVDELWAAVMTHRAHLAASGALDERRRDRLRHQLQTAVSAALAETVDRQLADGEADGLLAEVLARRLDPWTAAGRIVGGGADE